MDRWDQFTNKKTWPLKRSYEHELIIIISTLSKVYLRRRIRKDVIIVRLCHNDKYLEDQAVSEVTTLE